MSKPERSIARPGGAGAEHERLASLKLAFSRAEAEARRPLEERIVAERLLGGKATQAAAENARAATEQGLRAVARAKLDEATQEPVPTEQPAGGALKFTYTLPAPVSE